MRVKFVNIKPPFEEVTFEGTADRNLRSAQIDSYVNSSDMGINANKGQDFAWRLDPEVAAEFDEIKADYARLETISKAIGVTPENVTDGQILSYMVSVELSQEAAKTAKVDNVSTYEDAYRKKVSAAKERKANPTAAAEKPVVKPVKK
jgi:hypothetical protein